MVEVVFEDSAAGSLRQALVGRHKVAETGIVLYVREEGEDPLSPEEKARLRAAERRWQQEEAQGWAESLPLPGQLRDILAFPLAHAHYLAGELAKLGFALRSGDKPFFHEFLTDCPVDPAKLCAALEEQGILGGLPVDGGILWCCTELNRKEEMDRLLAVIGEVCKG